MTENFQPAKKEALDQEDALAEEKLHRKNCIDRLGRHIASSQGRNGQDFTAEALFYCEENGYDYGKALEAYEQDRAFEVAQLT